MQVRVQVVSRLSCDSNDFFLVLADVDPLGVNQNVTFDEVGGLDDRELLQLWLSADH